MTPEEKRRYRAAKKRRRRMQIMAELGLIVIIVIVAFSIVSGLIKGRGNAEEAEDTETVETADVDNDSFLTKLFRKDDGLKVTSQPIELPEQPVEVEVEDTLPEIKAYSAQETENTAYVWQESVGSDYAILINNDTDEIVAKKNSFDTIYPASMTKVMTVLTAVNHMTPEQLDDTVAISHEAVDYAYAHDCSTSGFSENEVVTVRDLLYGTILPSGGDAAIQLAMYVGGDVDSFVALMNEDLAAMGLAETTHFTNPVGIYADDHYSTVYDIAMIMEAALDNETLYPVMTSHTYDSTPTTEHPEGITISNWFLRRIEDKDIPGTIEGAKTGYVVQSGNCAVSSLISESGTQYICCTGKASGSWPCIEDHVAIYSGFVN